MLKITESRKKMARVKALRILDELSSDRMIEEKMMSLERSANERDRIQAITMRSILNGDTDDSFRKACKVYTKTTKEKLRFA